MKKTIVFIILFVLVFSSLSFAVSDEHIFEYNKGDKTYKVVSSSELYIVREYVDIVKDYRMRLRNKTGTPFTVYVKQGSSYVVDSSNTLALDVIDFSLIYTNYNIYFGDTVFFSAPRTTLDIVQEETQKILPGLVGKTRMILPVGSGVLSLMLSIMLLVVFLKRYRHRLI